jgi:tRNA pseudouridine55 synthase
VNGVLLIDKPSGPTSFDAVRAVRRAAGQRKVGHAGTLDPLASGLLVICVGQGTKLVPFLMAGDKRYLATVRLGFETDTDDALGEPTADTSPVELGPDEVVAVLGRFRGEIEQVPPAFSALKSGGEPLHRKARRGEPVAPEPRRIAIHALELVGVAGDEIRLDIRCSKGTYVRSLARDLGRALGTRAHLSALRRTGSSGFDVRDALPLPELQPLAESGGLAQRIIPLARALPSRPAVELAPDELIGVRNGNPLPLAGRDEIAALGIGSQLRLIDPAGELIAIARLDGELLQPVRVFLPGG